MRKKLKITMLFAFLAIVFVTNHNVTDAMYWIGEFCWFISVWNATSLWGMLKKIEKPM